MKFAISLGICDNEYEAQKMMIPEIVLDIDESNIENSKQKIKSQLNEWVDKLFETGLKQNLSKEE